MKKICIIVALTLAVTLVNAVGLAGAGYGNQASTPMSVSEYIAVLFGDEYTTVCEDGFTWGPPISFDCDEERDAFMADLVREVVARSEEQGATVTIESDQAGR